MSIYYSTLLSGEPIMTEFNRYRIKGETYFFTLALHDWPPELLADHIKALCATLLEIKRKHRFSIDALVILPKHLSCILTLPKNGRDFPLRWRLIKSELSSRIAIVEQRVLTPQARHEGRTRQQGFWECALRDDSDFARHMDYLHYRPVKQGLVKQVADWPYSTFFQYVKQGIYNLSWRPDDSAQGNVQLFNLAG